MDNKVNPFNTLFVQNFIGQEVELLINLYHKSEQSNAEEMMSSQSPLAMRGYILDIDEEYIYLGESPNGITKFVRKELVVGGDIIKEDKVETVFDDILNDLPTDGSAN